VSVLAGVLLSLSATLLFRHMMWSGANILLALGATLLAAGASTVHYLARPHIFTFVGLTVSLWILDRDRQKPDAAVWWLVPLTALWVNLHGGFLAWLACLALVTAGCALKAALEPKGSPARFAPLRVTRCCWAPARSPPCSILWLSLAPAHGELPEFRLDPAGG